MSDAELAELSEQPLTERPGKAGPAVAPLRFDDARRGGGILLGNGSATCLDLGEGVLGVEIHSRLNLCDSAVIDLLERAPDLVRRQFRALVIGSADPRVFSAGADLAGFAPRPAGPPAAGSRPAAGGADLAGLEIFLRRDQRALQGLRYADFPVVAAAGGRVLGGGLDLMLHADAVVAHAGLSAGFPERWIGLLPGWGGVAQMMVRAQGLCGDIDAAARLALGVIAGARIQEGVAEARVCGLLRDDDWLVADPALLLAVAKARALALARGYARPPAAGITAAGPAALPALEAEADRIAAAGGLAAVEHDAARAAARIVAGGGAVRGARLSEIDVARMERAAILDLARSPAVWARLAELRRTGRRPAG